MRDLDGHYHAAFDLLTSSRVREAFDIAAEPAQIRDAYGRHEFGQSALLARRLVERGVTSFVTVNTQPWDHHGTANRYATAEGSQTSVAPVRLRRRGAGARPCGSRTVRANDDRCHGRVWPHTSHETMRPVATTGGHTFSVLMGGGTLRQGIVVGASDGQGAYVAERPLSPEDMAATVYHHLGIDGRTTAFPDRAGRPLYLVETGEPIRELVG